MIIATWNVNGIRARSTRVFEWLQERKPDVACLQELKTKEDELDRDAFKAAGYEVVMSGQPGWNGVAVMSREPVETIIRELPGAGELGARFITAKTFGIEVTSLYIPNGKTASNPEFKTKLKWLELLATHVESRADKDAPMLLGGDFNVCLTDLDSYLGARAHGTIFHTDEERGFVNRLTAAGLVDLYRAKFPSEPGFSWWDYRAGAFHRKLGMRLDLLLATPAVAKRVTNVTIDREFRKKSKTSGALPSDHAPVYATLE